MASLRRFALLTTFVSVLGAVLCVADPEPPAAKASVVCDVGIGAAEPIMGALGIGNPAGDVCNAVTDPVLGLPSKALDPLRDAAKSLGQGVFKQITTWASDGAVWLLGRVVTLINETTTPNLLGKGFLRQYGQMASIAAVLAVLMLILAALEALGRGDGGMLWRVFMVNVPVAALATSAAYVVVQLLIGATDGFSEVIARSTASDTKAFFKDAVDALAQAGGATDVAVEKATGGAGVGSPDPGAVGIPLFVGLIAATLAALAAFLVWIELLMRDAAIYAVALFMPLAIAASIWPRWSSALRRTAELTVVVVFSKFVIVAIIALATSLLANTGGKVEQVLVAGALLLLACFSPLVLFRLVPFAESAVSSAYNRQSAGATSMRAVQTGSTVQRMHQVARSNWGSPAVTGSPSTGRAAGPVPGGGHGAGTAGASGKAAAASTPGVVAPAAMAGAAAAKAGKVAAAGLGGSAAVQARSEGGSSGEAGGRAGPREAKPTPQSAPRPPAAQQTGPQSGSGTPTLQPEPAQASGGTPPGAQEKPARPLGESSAPPEDPKR